MIPLQKYEKWYTPFQLRRPLLVAIGQGLSYRGVKLRNAPFERRVDVGEFFCCFDLYVLDLQHPPRDCRIGHRSPVPVGSIVKHRTADVTSAATFDRRRYLGSFIITLPLKLMPHSLRGIAIRTQQISRGSGHQTSAIR